MRDNKFLPVKSNAYGKFTLIGTHLLLIVFYVVMPFIFSNSLLETETTFRFIGLAAISSFSFFALAIFSMFSRSLSLPALVGNHFYKFLFLFLAYLGYMLQTSINKGEAEYDILKFISISGYAFLFITMLRNNEEGLLWLFKYSNIAISAFSLITLSQIGLQLGPKHGSLHLDYTLSSSLGNKNFYAETMTLFLPVIIMSAISLQGRWRRYSFANLVLLLFTIIILQTLSTWVALGAATVFTLLMWWLMRSFHLLSGPIFPLADKRKVFLIVSLIGLISLGIFYKATDGFSQISTRLHKLHTYASDNESYKHENVYQQNSISERIYLWQNALRMYRDKPVTGVGLDNWRVLSTKYGLPFNQYAMDNNVRFMRPHNDLLLLLAEGGAVGLALYLALFAFALFIFIRLMRSPLPDRDKMIILLSASGLIIYLFIACFSLPGDRFYTQILLFQFFGILCYYYEKNYAAKSSKFLMVLVSLFFVADAAALLYVAGKRYASEIHLIYALQAQSKQDWKKMSYHAGAAKDFYFPMDYTGTPIAWYQGMAAFNSNQPGIAKFYFEEALHANPYHLQVLNDLATAEERNGNPDVAMKL